MAGCLHPCPSCARHVRADETTCPFCDAALSADLAACASARAPGQALSRAALVFATAAAIASTACGKEAKDVPSKRSTADASSPLAVPAYGPPPQMLERDAGAPEKGPR